MLADEWVLCLVLVYSVAHMPCAGVFEIARDKKMHEHCVAHCMTAFVRIAVLPQMVRQSVS